MPSVHPLDLLIGIVGAVVIRLIVYVKGKNAKKYRKGAEYGSARWGNAEDIKPYIDPDFQNNIILTQTERLTMNSRPKQPKYARNKNVVVIGGSGSGKTRFFVKPNLMQLHSSYVLTDPKGTVLIECGKLLQRGGYKIKVLNTINFKKSMRYNPFVYIRSEKDVLKVVNTLIVNTKGEGEKSAEDFWVKAERLLYCALIGYIWYEAPAEEMNFTTLLELINASEAREDDEEYQSPVDLLFADLEERSPDHFAVKQYKKYKLAAGKTAKSILISCGARLAPFDIEELRELMSYDELELDTLGDRKTALFLIMSDTDDTFNFVIASRNLIRTHYHQHIFRRKDTILCEYIQDGMLCKESLCKVDKVGDNAIVCISPKGSKLKAVACLFLLGFTCRCGILDSIIARCVRVVFGVRAVGDYENLYVFVKSRACPKAIALIAIDLIERFTDRHTAAFQLNMYEGQTVDEHGHVVAVIVLCTLCRADHVLIQHLQLVVVNIVLVDQADVLGSTVITAKHLHVILLYLARFLRDSLV